MITTVAVLELVVVVAVTITTGIVIIVGIMVRSVITAYAATRDQCFAGIDGLCR